MTEVGMALSCGLDPATRVDGSVGWPLPSVEARLVDVETNEVIREDEEVDQDGRPRQGEIQLRGPTVFSQYWRNPSATEAEFVPSSEENGDGDQGGRWFRTGDVAIRRTVHLDNSDRHDNHSECGSDCNSSSSSVSSNQAEKRQHFWMQGPMYFIQGRKSVDIIKSGGEKVSALEVERELLSLPQISEAAVVGLPSDVWGQKITAVVVLKTSAEAQGDGHPAINVTADGDSKSRASAVLEMRRALRSRLASHKIPQAMDIVSELPRNAMGKGLLTSFLILVGGIFGLPPLLAPDFAIPFPNSLHCVSSAPLPTNSLPCLVPLGPPFSIKLSL